MVWLWVALIQSDEAYAERKNVSGTGKVVTDVYQDEKTKSFKGFIVVTHPGGDQTFLEYEGKWEAGFSKGQAGEHLRIGSTNAILAPFPPGSQP